MDIKLSNGDIVVLKDKLKYGDTLEIQKVMLEGVGVNKTKQDINIGAENIINSTIKTMEIAVIEIKRGVEKLQFSREWLNDLDIEDGNLLQEKVNEMSNKKK